MGQVPILLPWGRVLVDIFALPHFDDIFHNIIIGGNGGKCKGRMMETLVKRCHCEEPQATWQSPGSREDQLGFRKIVGIATPVCALARNDMFFCKKPPHLSMGRWVMELDQHRKESASPHYISKGSMPRTGWPFSDR